MKKLLLFAPLFVFLISCNNSNDNEVAGSETGNLDTEEAENNSNAFIKNSFPKLFAYYEKSDTTFDTNNFEEAQLTPIDSAASYAINKEQLQDFYSYFILDFIPFVS